MENNLIVLDGDGVLVDYHHAYAQAWGKAFGEVPAIKDPDAYWALDRYDVRKLHGDELDHFKKHMDYEFWATMPAMPGAVEACQKLVDAGYKLICVTALEDEHKSARWKNLLDLGMPLEGIVCTGHGNDTASPKASVLSVLNPVAFADDFVHYMRGIPPHIHAALIMRSKNGTPNVGPDLKLAHSQHADILSFAEYWVNR
jgi:hypothetical protein